MGNGYLWQYCRGKEAESMNMTAGPPKEYSQSCKKDYPPPPVMSKQFLVILSPPSCFVFEKRWHHFRTNFYTCDCLHVAQLWLNCSTVLFLFIKQCCKGNTRIEVLPKLDNYTHFLRVSIRFLFAYIVKQDEGAKVGPLPWQQLQP